ncbi:hypothetical protein, partial [Mesorhizobium sp.]|uniref:hypothetical protein n=1 Tax=Mesorhizobium sp. TaxID=1871066 RepID=UPI0025CF953E
GVDLDDRQALASALEQRQGQVWDAFVSSFCLTAVDIDPPVPGRKAFVLEANIQTMCEQFDKKAQRIFARAFLSRDRCAKGPDDPTSIGSITGLRNEWAHGGWASAALAANSAGQSSNYYDGGDLNSPTALLGVVQFNAVRPFRAAPPDWSLAEWEAAGVCLGAKGEDLKIKAIRLRGGGQNFRIVDTLVGKTKAKTSHALKVWNGERELITVSAQGLDWSLPEVALSDLTVRDIDALVWAGTREPRSPTIRPEGCVRRAES